MERNDLIACHFKAFNWKTGMPTHYPESCHKEQLFLDSLIAPDILQTFSVARFTVKGAVLLDPTQPLCRIPKGVSKDAVFDTGPNRGTGSPSRFRLCCWIVTHY